jgi:hypothetical protein
MIVACDNKRRMEMHCPTCGKPMELLKQDMSRSKIEGKVYDRQIYGCQSDDVWVTLETPKQVAEQQERLVG